MDKATWQVDEWTGCYPSRWTDVNPLAIVHPAKFSSRLIKRIYEHMQAEKWLKEGDTVLDPFGGVALGAVEAMRLGLHWRGVELEPRFVELGGLGYDCPGFDLEWWKRYYFRPDYIRKQRAELRLCPNCENAMKPVVKTRDGKVTARSVSCRDAHTYRGNIPLWGHKYSRMPHWGDAVLLRGDSRKLLEVLNGGGQSVVSSPPYADSVNSGEGSIDWDKAGRPDRLTSKAVGIQGANHREERYGSSGGQLGVMKADGQKFMAALSSPPYCEARIGQESGQEHCGRGDQYGESDGQLGAMKDTKDGFSASVSSPPFEQRSADGGWQMLGKYAEEGKLTVKQVKGDKGKSYPSWDKDRDTSYGESDGQMSAMKGTEDGFSAAISSPPFRQSEGGTPEPKAGGAIDARLYARHAAGNSAAEGYGGSDGQLANMEEGDFQSAVSSPPYNLPMSQDHNGKRGGARGTTPSEDGAFVKYGNEDGQLEGMSMSGFEAAVSSPPFEKTEGAHSASKFKDPAASARERSEGYKSGRLKGHFASEEAILRSMEKANEQAYGDSDGQLGNDSGDDFWLAARQIVEQVYQALEPGGHAVWVTKNFVKDKKIVDFSDQWRQLCEAVGFKTLHEHRAMLVRSNGKSHTLDGGVVEHTKAAKSFFRRLAESKGSPEINWESVWCMVKEA